jgi:hypothetical protein
LEDSFGFAWVAGSTEEKESAGGQTSNDAESGTRDLVRMAETLGIGSPPERT